MYMEFMIVWFVGILAYLCHSNGHIGVYRCSCYCVKLEPSDQKSSTRLLDNHTCRRCWEVVVMVTLVDKYYTTFTVSSDIYDLQISVATAHEIRIQQCLVTHVESHVIGAIVLVSCCVYLFHSKLHYCNNK